MADDAGAARGPGVGGRRGFHEALQWPSDRPRPRARSTKAEDKECIPVTKLGQLVKDMKIKPLEEIYLFSSPIKQSEIIDFFLGISLKDEDACAEANLCWPADQVQGICRHGGLQWSCWLGLKCSKEVATAIHGAIILAKLSTVPVRTGYWGNKIGKPHTVPCKARGCCGSVLVRLISAPRDTGTVSALVPKKPLLMAGTDDCYTSARACTATLGNSAEATFDTISTTYSYLTPDLHQPSCESSHQSLCPEDSSSSSSYNIKGFYTRKVK